MSKATIDWATVLTELRGTRLRILDELMAKGAMDLPTIYRHLGEAHPSLLEPIEWLALHRLIVCEDGIWRAIHPGLARQQVEMNGLALPPTAAKPTPSDARPAAVRGQTPAVHRHQVELFTNAGYRDSNGSLQ